MSADQAETCHLFAVVSLYFEIGCDEWHLEVAGVEHHSNLESINQ